MRVNILDIAKAAGVSKSTVSLVLNDDSKVKLETRLKVQKVISELGYVPNAAARELITNNTNRIGLIFLTENIKRKASAFNAVVETLLYDISNGISKGLCDTEYSLLIERFAVKETGERLPKMINDRRVDGVLLIGGLFQTDFVEQIKVRGIPAVIVGRRLREVDSITVNYEKVGYLGGQYLLETGHKNIAFINGPIDSANSAEKLKGFKKALDEAGYGLNESLLGYADYTGESGYKSFWEMWEKGARPDAVFGGSDGITMGILRCLYKKGLRVPEDISVLGYEDSVLAEHAAPALATIDTDREQMGERAWEVLLNRIERPKAKVVSLSIDPSLILRDSVKPR